MAHIGAFLPCEAAQVSLFDQIFAQFSTVETCAVPQSSFQLDLTQMGTILRRSTRRTLVLLDEFGKGTSPASGIALLSAAIRKFASLQATVVCTTHFLEVFSRRLLSDGKDGINALRMAVHIPQDTGDIAKPLFRLDCGVADSSAGIICAKMAGLHRAVVARAQEIVVALKAGTKLEPRVDVQKAIVSKLLSPAANDVLRTFLSKPSWENASNEDIHNLLEKIQKLAPEGESQKMRV